MFETQLFVSLFVITSDAKDFLLIVCVSRRFILCRDDLVDILPSNGAFHKVDALFVIGEFALVAKGVEEYEKGVNGVFFSLPEIFEFIVSLLYSSVVLKDGLELLLEVVPIRPT